MLCQYNPDRVFGVAQMFVKRDRPNINFLRAQVMYEFLVAGKMTETERFMNELKHSFEIGGIIFQWTKNQNWQWVHRVGHEVLHGQ